MMNQDTKFIYENAIGHVEFSYGSPFWITEIDGISSVETDIISIRSPEQIGASVTRKHVKPKTFTINGSIFEPITYTRKKMIQVFAPELPSKLICIQNEESYYIDLHVIKTPDISSGVGIQHFQITVYAEYPYWKNSEYMNIQLAGLKKKFRLPFNTGGTWSLSEFTGNSFTQIDNHGNVPIGFILRYVARTPVVNPEIFLNETRQRILIQKEMASGEVIEISTIQGERGVKIYNIDGTIENGFRYLSIDSDLSMQINTGQNIIRISAENREGLGATIEAPKGVLSGV